MPHSSLPRVIHLPFVIQEPNVGADAGATYAGRSFKSLEGVILSTYSIKATDVRVVNSGGGESDLKIISSFSALRNFLNISWEASAKFPGIGEGRSRGSYLEEVKSTKYKLFIAMKKRVELRWAYLRQYLLSDELKAALSKEDLAIYENFGDRYVQEVFLGGEFVSVINLSTDSYYENQRLVASLDVSVDAIGGGASVSTDKVSTILNRYLNINVQIFWTGVHRSPPVLINGLDELGSGQVKHQDLLDYFSKFEDIVQSDQVYRPVRIVTAQTAQDWPVGRDFIDLEASELASSKLRGYEDDATDLHSKWDDVYDNPYHYRDAYDRTGTPIDNVAALRTFARSHIEKLDNLIRQVTGLQDQLSLNPFADLGDIDSRFWSGLKTARSALPFRQRTFTPVLLTHSDHTKHNPSSGAGNAPNQRKRVVMRGTDYRADSMWFPYRRGTRLQMWSLRIEMEEPRPPGIRIEYKAAFADGLQTDWVIQGDELVHPTSRGTRFRQIAFRLQGSMAGAYNLEYQVHRTEYGDMPYMPGTLDPEHPPGTLVGGPVQNIENIRLSIWPKSDIDEV